MSGHIAHVAQHQAMTAPPIWRWAVLPLALGAAYAVALLLIGLALAARARSAPPDAGG